MNDKSSNADQIEYWNGPVGKRWALEQERLDLNTQVITDAAMPFANPHPGEHVLDIGCGCGTTTLLLAYAVAPEGTAAGLDVSAPMLGVARARAEAQNADVEFVEDDAATHDFQPVFDLVFSRFGVMFFADPVAAFANIRKALAPGGRLVFVCWRPLKDNLWAAVPMMAAKDLLPPQEPVDPYAPGPFAYAEKPRLEIILRDAGFREVRIDSFEGRMGLGANAEEATSFVFEIGPLARAARELDEGLRSKIRAAVLEALRGYETKMGVTLPAACWFVEAKG